MQRYQGENCTIGKLLRLFQKLAGDTSLKAAVPRRCRQVTTHRQLTGATRTDDGGLQDCIFSPPPRNHMYN